MNPDDVLVGDLARQHQLALEARLELLRDRRVGLRAWANHLDRDRDAELVIEGLVDGAHAADAEQLYTRPQDPTDNATPSGLSAAVHALRLMAELTGIDRYAARADRAAASASELVRRAPRFAGWLLADAISQTSGRRPVQVAVVGPDNAARAALAYTAHQMAPAGSVVLAGMPDQPGLALLADRPMINDQPTAYVCRHFVCRLPVTSVDALASQFLDS